MRVKTLNAYEVNRKIKNREFKLIIDLRSEELYATGHLPGAINIPTNQINDYLGYIRSITNDNILLYCAVGSQSSATGKVLLINGFKNVFHLKNGIVKYNYKLQRESK